MKRNLIFIGLLIALVMATGMIVYERMTVESTADSMEITLSYTDFEAMAAQSEYDLVWWFEFLKEAGVHSVAIEEETINSLIAAGQPIDYDVLMNIERDLLWEMRYPEAFVDFIRAGTYDGNDLVLVTDDRPLFDFILEGLSFYPDLVTTFESQDQYAMVLDGRVEDLRYSTSVVALDANGRNALTSQEVVGSAVMDYGIGFDPDKIEKILAGGLQPHLRPWSNLRYPEEALDHYFASVAAFDLEPSLLIFAGAEVVGYPTELKRLNDWMTDNGVAPVLIETGVQRTNADQKGLYDLVENAEYQAIRTLPITEYMQMMYRAYGYKGGEEIENIMFRAAVERNIRLIYFRPYLKSKTLFITNPDVYSDSFERLEDRLAKHDIEVGAYSVMTFHDEQLWTGILIGLGLTVIMILMCRFYFNFKIWFEYLILLAGGLCVAGALVVAPNLGRQLIALTAAIVVASLGGILMIEFAKDRFADKQVFRTHTVLLKAILLTISMVLLATFGGTIVAALLSHSKYLLKLEFYRGVKASQILPLMAFALVYFLKFGFNRSTEELRTKEVFPKDLLRVMNLQIKVGYIVVGTFVLAALYVFMARSGNDTSVQVSNLEIMMRNFLEMTLPARPRTKEFMIAIPSMMLFAYGVYKGYRFSVVLMGFPAMITFTSIINTFSHSRAPLYMSFYRTAFGALFGIVIGVVAIGGIELVERLVKRLMKKGLNYDKDHHKELGA